jgi:hypothetical protein
MTYNQISGKLGFICISGKRTKPAAAKTDEFECYKWSMEQSGIDSLNPPKDGGSTCANRPYRCSRGGAAKGAAAGVAIGAIAGDAGEGAAIGAVAGGLAGRRKGETGAKPRQTSNRRLTLQTRKRLSRIVYIKGFSACMEGKGYTIK